MALERHPGHRSLTRSLRSPLAFLAAGAAAVVAVVAGAPEVAAVGLGAAGYGAGVAASAALGSRGRRPERLDPFTLGEPWRQRVREALAARNRYTEALERVRPGPLRDRLADIGERVEAGVAECWRVANQGNALGQGLATLRIGELRRTLAAAETEAGEGGDERVAALRAQLGSAERMEATAADADDRLRLLSARLDEAAARAVELSLGAGTDADLIGLGSEVDQVVDQLEALRLALDELER